MLNGRRTICEARKTLKYSSAKNLKKFCYANFAFFAVKAPKPDGRNCKEDTS